MPPTSPQDVLTRRVVALQQPARSIDRMSCNQSHKHSQPTEQTRELRLPTALHVLLFDASIATSIICVPRFAYELDLGTLWSQPSTVGMPGPQ